MGIEIDRRDSVTFVVIGRGKVNALDEASIDELGDCFAKLREDSSTRAVVLTGRGSFFSFGFDIPAIFDYDEGEFTRYVTKFTRLFTDIFSFPAPVIGALNGHAIAGGCMLATACDARLGARGKMKISLNEITFGASVFAGAVEMLVTCVGERHAARVLYSGAMYSQDDALEIGLLDEVVEAGALDQRATERALASSRNLPAFRHIKELLRDPIVARMKEREASAIERFVDIWYSSATREQVSRIEIRK